MLPQLIFFLENEISNSVLAKRNSPYKVVSKIKKTFKNVNV